jgi:ABC-2 type transport system permease protein
MQNILIILHKEWLEIRQQRGLLLGIIIPFLVLALLPIALLYVTSLNIAVNLHGINLSKVVAIADLSPREALQVFTGREFSTFYALFPVMMPSVIASYSIVGEKTSHTLEPLLATPVRIWELLVGKSLIALLPSIILTWFCGLCFVVAAALFSISGRVFVAIISPAWLVVLLLWTPLLALIAVAVMVAVSSRVNDPRTAQQMSAWVVIPFLALFYGQLLGFVSLSIVLALGVALILLILMALTIWLATRLFQREVILTRWK